MKRINTKQLEWIDGWRCERLTLNPENEDIILSFAVSTSICLLLMWMKIEL